MKQTMGKTVDYIPIKTVFMYIERTIEFPLAVLLYCLIIINLHCKILLIAAS